jgi:glycine/D-amino acid oxidase-like deaminating enzyme
VAERVDAVVVGGGFYGATIAAYLKRQRGLERVVLLERAPQLMSRSSFTNQARVHNGYHYPRSFTTAYRSRINMPRFIRDYEPAVVSNFTKLYALARRNSKVTPGQMERFCREIGAPLKPAPRDLQALFNPSLIERVYVTVEQAFNADILRDLVARQLAETGVEVRLGAESQGLRTTGEQVSATGRDASGRFELTADMAFNCCYSRLQSAGGKTAPAFGLRHEITEMTLIRPPPALAGLGITVMDGPFFSTMPFPARGLHSLSHVRYTPHLAWIEDGRQDPYAQLEAYSRESRAEWMIRDSARYVPALGDARAEASLFEVKTVLTRSEGDDGRPILFQRHGDGGRVFSILGGKIDNIYDILERLDAEALPSTLRR